MGVTSLEEGHFSANFAMGFPINGDHGNETTLFLAYEMGFYPLVMTNNEPLNMVIEIVSFPALKWVDIPHHCPIIFPTTIKPMLSQLSHDIPHKW